MTVIGKINKRKMEEANVNEDIINKIINSDLSDKAIMSCARLAIDGRNIAPLLTAGLNDDQISALETAISLGDDISGLSDPSISADDIIKISVHRRIAAM